MVNGDCFIGPIVLFNIGRLAQRQCRCRSWPLVGSIELIKRGVCNSKPLVLISALFIYSDNA